MTDETQFAVIPFTPRRPERLDDIRNDIIRNLHQQCVLMHDQIRNWERWGDNQIVQLKLMQLLLGAGRVDEAEAFLATAIDQACRLTKASPLVDLPPGLDGG